MCSLTLERKVLVNGVKVGRGEGRSVLAVGKGEIVLDVKRPVAEETSRLVLEILENLGRD